MLENAQVYNKWSVFILANSLRHLVNYCLTNMKLSPLHYSTLPSFAFESAFQHSGASYKFIKDTKIIKWLEPATRAGLSFSNVRFVQANCERLGCFNGVNEKRSHIIEMDLTSAYPSCAARFLVEGEYTWLDTEDILKLDPLMEPDDGEIGYVFEVSFNYLPLGASKRVIEFDE
jgi:hypothetical protein